MKIYFAANAYSMILRFTQDDSKNIVILNPEYSRGEESCPT